jgi:putative transposase
VIGGKKDGSKSYLALEPGYRESKELWGEVLRQLKLRGVKSARLCVEDGNLELWAAVGAVYPQAQEQLCWNHSVPRRAQTRRMRCSFTDKTSKSVSMGQMVAT